jgi:hypothetical protein
MTLPLNVRVDVRVETMGQLQPSCRQGRMLWRASTPTTVCDPETFGGVTKRDIRDMRVDGHVTVCVLTPFRQTTKKASHVRLS